MDKKFLAIGAAAIIFIVGITANVMDYESAPSYGVEMPATDQYGDQGQILGATNVCTATPPEGAAFDPCAMNLAYWKASFWNALNTNAYFPKWKKANPGEWNRLYAYLTNGVSYYSDTLPTVATGYGGVIRFGFVQCKAWVYNASECNVTYP